jgi:hypothetical protein
MGAAKQTELQVRETDVHMSCTRQPHVKQFVTSSAKRGATQRHDDLLEAPEVEET